MKPGDILAYKINKETTNIFSRLISWISRVTVGNWLVDGEDSFNHVAILSDVPGMQYELTWPNGGLNPIKWDKYDVYSVVYQGLTDEQRKKILEYCKNNSKKEYDWLAIITFGLLSIGGKSICSRFVANAYLFAGIDLRKPKESLISPNETAYHEKMILDRIYKPI